MDAQSTLRRLKGAGYASARRVYRMVEPFTNERAGIARRYLKGYGLEIGALHNPLRVGHKAHVRYVDRLPVAKLRRHYPELAKERLVGVDILDDGERLSSVGDTTQDFVIANHMLEHCQDPLGALQHMLRVLKPGGILFLAVPDKRRTFDSERACTSFEHLLRDHVEGPEWSKQQHFEEWVRFVDKVTDDHAAREQVAALIAADYSIHFHVWTATDFAKLVLALPEVLHVSCEIELLVQRGDETIAIIRKSAVK
jgi:SAM-dependent methyltransferase